MLHNATFYQGLHCFYDKNYIQTKHTLSFYYKLRPLDMYNGLSQVYCIQTKRKNPLGHKGLKHNIPYILSFTKRSQSKQNNHCFIGPVLKKSLKRFNFDLVYSLFF